MRPLKVTTKALTKAHEKVLLAWRRIENSQHFHSVIDSPPDSYRVKLAELRSLHEAAVTEQSAILDPIKEAVETALHQINGRAKSFAITTFHEVRNIADRVETLLADRGVTIKNRVGTTATYVPAGPSANSYKYKARSTGLTLHRVADGWRLAGISEAHVYPKQAEKLNVSISEDAYEDIMRSAMENMAVVRELAA